MNKAKTSEDTNKIKKKVFSTKCTKSDKCPVDILYSCPSVFVIQPLELLTRAGSELLVVFAVFFFIQTAMACTRVTDI
jgi:hypothetical protein